MKAMLTCNYAVVRFLPYRETAEFVNVGIVLFCPQTGYFDAKLETRKQGRVTGFFPELDKNLFRSGRQMFHHEVERVRQLLAADTRAADDPVRLGVFRELVKPRESVFRFSEVATVLAGDPAAKLEELFNHFVNRQFALAREYQENVMARRLTEVLRAHQLARFYLQNRRVGTDDFHVVFPLVTKRGQRGACPAAPLNRWTSTGTSPRRFTSMAMRGSGGLSVCGRSDACRKDSCFPCASRPTGKSGSRPLARSEPSYSGATFASCNTATRTRCWNSRSWRRIS